MDFHPIIVHFPIALLTVYAIMELVWSKKLRSSSTWMHIKVSFLLIGLIGAYAALSSGDAAAHQYAGDRSLVHTHEFFASMTTNIFLILTIGYLVEFISTRFPHLFKGKTLKNIWSVITKLKNIILHTPLVYVLALAGLILVTITGALGGALVYGPDVDPIVSFVYGLVA